MTNHYHPPIKNIESQSSVYFDGSQSSTGAAYVEEISGNFNARIYIEHANNGSFERVSQFPTARLQHSWHTTDINMKLIENSRRICITNASTDSGVVEMIGEEI